MVDSLEDGVHREFRQVARHLLQGDLALGSGLQAAFQKGAQDQVGLVLRRELSDRTQLDMLLFYLVGYF